jgi:hypothetical protein
MIIGKENEMFAHSARISLYPSRLTCCLTTLFQLHELSIVEWDDD